MRQGTSMRTSRSRVPRKVHLHLGPAPACIFILPKGDYGVHINEEYDPGEDDVSDDDGLNEDSQLELDVGASKLPLSTKEERG